MPFNEADRLKHQLAAETKLAELDLHEEVAELHDKVDHIHEQMTTKFGEFERLLKAAKADKR